MKITRPMVHGAVVALVGQGLVLGATLALAVAAGGGPNTDLDAGGRFAALIFVVLTYAIAQLVLLGVCVAVAGRLGAGAPLGLTVGWMLGMAIGLFFMCGGFGI